MLIGTFNPMEPGFYPEALIAILDLGDKWVFRHPTLSLREREVTDGREELKKNPHVVWFDQPFLSLRPDEFVYGVGEGDFLVGNNLHIGRCLAMRLLQWKDETTKAVNMARYLVEIGKYCNLGFDPYPIYQRFREQVRQELVASGNLSHLAIWDEIHARDEDLVKGERR